GRPPLRAGHRDLPVPAPHELPRHPQLDHGHAHRADARRSRGAEEQLTGGSPSRGKGGLMRLSPLRPRRGSHIVECAIVLPLTPRLVFGLLVGSLGVFRYQEVASRAREGARYASVRGAKYQSVTGHSAATAVDVYNSAISPRMVILDPNRLNYTVTWNPDN